MTEQKVTREEFLEQMQILHHGKERELFFQTDILLNKILRVHFQTHGEELLHLHRVFSEWKMETEEELVWEERVIFPDLSDDQSDKQILTDRLSELVTRNEHMLELTEKVKAAANGFEIPEDVCPTYAETFDRMKELAVDIRQRIEKEKSFLQ